MHWRNSGNHAKFLMVDARASYPLLLFLVHMRIWTFGLWVFSMIFFGILNYMGYTLPTALRMFRAKAAGPLRYTKPWWRRPEMIRTPKE